MIGELIVATTTASADDAIVEACQVEGIAVFRGSEEDVLDRYCKAAESLDLDVIVRITADCPLIDPEIIDQVVTVFLDQAPDYASNVIQRSFPAGLDVEAVDRQVLERVREEARQKYQRAHVTSYIYENPDLFRLASVGAEADFSAHRWTVDTPEDLALIREIYKRLQNSDSSDWRTVVDLLADEPGLADINRHVRQKKLTEG